MKSIKIHSYICKTNIRESKQNVILKLCGDPCDQNVHVNIFNPTRSRPPIPSHDSPCSDVWLHSGQFARNHLVTYDP